MPNQPFEHRPLENLMRGVEDLDALGSSDEIADDLKERGMDVPKMISAAKSLVQAKLQQRRIERERQIDFAQNVARGLRVWTHPSVKRFAQGEDPVQKIIATANSWVLQACEDHLSGSAVDVFAIAKWRSLPVCPRDDVADARTVPIASGGLQIEYNPHRSKARMRFSVAHELAHTFFPDCGEIIRNRVSRAEMTKDDWQLEMLCNLGAAELLMPIATFPEIRQESLSIDNLLELRKQYSVGIESLLLRIVRTTTAPCAIFVASQREVIVDDEQYSIDYVLGSRSWQPPIKSGDFLPKGSLAIQCKAIGYTAKGDEFWERVPDQMHIECVGITPLPNHRRPRVAGIIVPTGMDFDPVPKLVEVIGNALEPRGSGKKILAYIVNDKTPNWGAGFAKAVAAKWPRTQLAFSDWVSANRANLKLGSTFEFEIDDDLWLLPMICQHGYGSSSVPRIRYGALKESLDRLAYLAIREGATVHMPKLGSGYAKGLWPIISQMIDETLCFKGVTVTVYNLPGAKPEQSPELPGLFQRRNL